MKWLDFLLIALVAGYCVYLLLRKNKRGCCGDCGKCCGCNAGKKNV